MLAEHYGWSRRELLNLTFVEVTFWLDALGELGREREKTRKQAKSL